MKQLYCIIPKLSYLNEMKSYLPRVWVLVFFALLFNKTYASNYSILGLKTETRQYISDSCEAYFEYFFLNDSTVQFNDTSVGDILEWYWDFGDGTYSEQENPIHTYSNNGVYEVLLSISTTDSCIGRKSDFLIIESTKYLSGFVSAGSNFLPNGRVVLYTADTINSEFIPYLNTSFPVDSGFFSIPYSYYLPHILYVIPELNVPNLSFPEYFPSYYGNVIYWENADYFYPHEPEFVYIDLVKREGIFYGHGSIEGIITDQNGYYDLYETNILLLDTNKEPLKYASLKYNNTFVLNQLPYGDYYLLVNNIGIVSTPLFVSISEDNPIKNINFVINDNGITSIENAEEPNQVAVFPNPFSSNIFLHFNNTANKKIAVVVFNYSGQIIHSELVRIFNSKVQINLSHLSNGIYFIKTPEHTFKVQKTK